MLCHPRSYASFQTWGEGTAISITIRQAIPDDLPTIVGHYGRGDSPWDPFADLVRLWNIPLEGLIVAEVEGRYAGFLYWFVGEKPWFDVGVETYAHIVEVQVVEKRRGQGVGKRLLAYALERVKESSIEAIYIDTTKDNLAARHLYESAGFRPLFRTIHYRLRDVIT
jgi:ribosomal protein S18 acetylase RimI-like enzyme